MVTLESCRADPSTWGKEMLHRGGNTLMEKFGIKGKQEKKKNNNAYLFVMFASFDPRLLFKQEDDEAIYILI